MSRLHCELKARVSVITAAVLVATAFVYLANAQSDDKVPTLHRAPVDTNTPGTQSRAASSVKLLLTVHDKKNKAVGDLTQNDFTIADDGQPQRIQQFTRAAEQPLTLGLLVDTSPGQRAALVDERTASRSFLDQIVRADLDKAFVIHFDREVELLQDLTASHEKLEQAVDGLNSPQFSRTSSSQTSPSDDDDSGQQTGGRGTGRRTHGFGGAQLYDAIYLACNELMQKQSGRKVVVVLSDGVDRGSKESLESALEAAHRANTIIYSILEKSERQNQGGEGGERSRGSWGIPGMGGPIGGPGMGRRGGRGRNPEPQENRPDGKKILEQISTETGGQMFEASKKLTVEQIYSQIEDQLRNQYAVAYTPTRSQDAGDFHKLQVTTTKKDVVVLVPAGYYSTP
jgi:VWFA-related protein